MKANLRSNQSYLDPSAPVAGAIRWNYDRAELIADGIVHGVGLMWGIAASTALVVLASIYAQGGALITAFVYAAGLLAMLICSAAYNIWPVSRVKWLLRRFDHSAIFVLIAATYTPVFYFIGSGWQSGLLLGAVWLIALGGIYLKLFMPGRYEGLSLPLYLALGWSGVLVYEDAISMLPPVSLWFIAIGGILFSLGTVFHIWRSLRFQNAIWHGFVLLGAACHYTAVVDLVLA